MGPRQRRLAGVFLTVSFLIAYVLVAMAVAGDYAVGSGLFVELAAFVLLCIAWVPVVMLIIRWMSRPSP